MLDTPHTRAVRTLIFTTISERDNLEGEAREQMRAECLAGKHDDLSTEALEAEAAKRIAPNRQHGDRIHVTETKQ